MRSESKSFAYQLLPLAASEIDDRGGQTTLPSTTSIIPPFNTTDTSKPTISTMMHNISAIFLIVAVSAISVGVEDTCPPCPPCNSVSDKHCSQCLLYYLHETQNIGGIVTVLNAFSKPTPSKIAIAFLLYLSVQLLNFMLEAMRDYKKEFFDELRDSMCFIISRNTDEFNRYLGRKRGAA